MDSLKGIKFFKPGTWLKEKQSSLQLEPTTVGILNILFLILFFYDCNSTGCYIFPVIKWHHLKILTINLICIKKEKINFDLRQEKVVEKKNQETTSST